MVEYRRIHLPENLYNMIREYVDSENSPYRSVDELCREAGKNLIKRHGLEVKKGA